MELNNIIFYIDNYFCNKLRKVCHFTLFSENQVIQRYISNKFSRRVKHLSYPTLFTQGNTIWVFWWQGEENMPTIVKACYNSIKKNRGLYKVILLDQKNFYNYVNIPTYILNKLESGKISITHFSDILRFNLLAKYGGWWMDATIYLPQSIEYKNSLYTIKQPYNPDYISNGLWSGFLWYMPIGHPLAIFVRDCLHTYWYKENKLVAYFLIDHIIKLFYDKNYLFQREIQDLNCESPNLYFFQSSDSLKYYNELEWENIVKNNKFFKCNWKQVYYDKGNFHEKILNI